MYWIQQRRPKASLSLLYGAWSRTSGQARGSIRATSTSAIPPAGRRSSISLRSWRPRFALELLALRRGVEAGLGQKVGALFHEVGEWLPPSATGSRTALAGSLQVAVQEVCAVPEGFEADGRPHRAPLAAASPWTADDRPIRRFRALPKIRLGASGLQATGASWDEDRTGRKAFSDRRLRRAAVRSTS